MYRSLRGIPKKSKENVQNIWLFQPENSAVAENNVENSQVPGDESRPTSLNWGSIYSVVGEDI
jgi:hypothetical protein